MGVTHAPVFALVDKTGGGERSLTGGPFLYDLQCRGHNNRLYYLFKKMFTKSRVKYSSLK